MVEVSIIVPVYQAETTIERCIKSILKQTFSNFECILIDDGSLDNSGRICDNFGKNDERIKVIHCPNSGVSNARNMGLNNASGKYIMFVDSDDYITESYLDELYQSAIKNQASLIIAGYHITSKSPYLNDDRGIEFPVSDPSRIPDTIWASALTKGLLNSTWGKLFAKELVDSIRYRSKMDYGEDTIFLMDSLQVAKRVKFINSCGYNYFLGGGLSIKKDYKIAEYIADYLDELYVLSDYFSIRSDVWKHSLADKISNEILTYFDSMIPSTKFKQLRKMAITVMRNQKSRVLFKRWIIKEKNRLRYFLLLPAEVILQIYVVYKKF